MNHVKVDVKNGTEYVMNPRDGIYIGKGNKDISFKSENPEEPAKFYVSSCPVHCTYPTRHIDITKARKNPTGSAEECNKRVINQYIHPEVMQSCQLSMGLTQLEVGSNWNTMPCHTHDRRMEVYLYLDMQENDVVFHMMGEPQETRHIIMHNEEAVLVPEIIPLSGLCVEKIRNLPIWMALKLRIYVKRENKEHVNKISQKYGFGERTPYLKSSGSDASYTTMAGTPSICSMGPVGGRAHSREEYLEAETLISSAKVLAAAIVELPEDFGVK